MTDYEQMEIDVRLESEKDLKTNVGKVIKFFYDKRRMEAEESGWPLKQVKGKHEGYGIAAEAFSKIGAKMKALDRGMKDYLALLQVKGEDGVSICGDIYSQALELAMEAERPLLRLRQPDTDRAGISRNESPGRPGRG